MTNQRAGAGDRRGASVQRSGTGAARLYSGRRPPLGGRTRLVHYTEYNVVTELKYGARTSLAVTLAKQVLISRKLCKR